MSTNAELIDSILADTVLQNAPQTLQVPTITPEQMQAYYNMGKQQAAAKEALNEEELALYQEQQPQDSSLAQQMFMGAGAQEYADQSRAMDDAGLLDYARVGLAGAASGLASTFAGPIAMGIGTQLDMAAESQNNYLKMAGYTPRAHNYMGELTGAANDFAMRTLPKWIQPDEQTLVDEASAIRRQVREEADKLQYNKDLADGMSEEEAGFRDFFRSMASGIDNIFDNLGGFTKTTSQLAGQVTAQGLTMKGFQALTKLGVKNAAQTAERAAARAAERINARSSFYAANQKAADRLKMHALRLEEKRAARKALKENALVQAGILTATEAAASVGATSQRIDATSSRDLYENSPVYREAFDNYIAQGLSPQEADAQARIEAKMVASYIEAGIGGSSALIASRLARPFAPGMGSRSVTSVLKDSISEGLEEGATGFGQGIGGNVAIQQAVDRNQRTFEGVGAQVTEGAIAGLAGSAGLRTPGAIVGSINRAVQEANNSKASNLKGIFNSVGNKAKEATPIGNGTVTQASEDGSNEVKIKDFNLVQNADGTKSVQTKDPYFNNLFYDTDEHIKAAGVDIKAIREKGGEPDIGDKFHSLLSKLNKAVNDNDDEATGQYAQEYIKEFDAWKQRVKDKYDLIDTVQNDLNKKGTKAKPAEKLSTNLIEDIVRDVLAGGNAENIIKQRARTPEEKQAAILTRNDLVKLRSSRAAAQDIIDMLASIKAVDIAQGKATPAQVNAMAQKAAEGTLSQAQIKAYSAYADKNKAKLREDEKRLKAILDMQAEIEQRLPTIKNANVKKVAENAHRTSRGTRIATKDIVDSINKGIANNDKVAIREGLARLEWFADNHLNKLTAMQTQLKNNDFAPASYTARSSLDGAPFEYEISYRSPRTYNEIFQETQDLANLYNKYSEVLQDLGISFKDLGLAESRTVPSRLENEELLMANFYETHRQEYKQARDERKSEQQQKSKGTNVSSGTVVNININGQNVSAATDTSGNVNVDTNIAPTQDIQPTQQNQSTQPTESSQVDQTTDVDQATQENLPPQQEDLSPQENQPPQKEQPPQNDQTVEENEVTPETQTIEETPDSEAIAEAPSNAVETQQQEQSTDTQQEAEAPVNTVSEAIQEEEEVPIPDIKQRAKAKRISKRRAYRSIKNAAAHNLDMEKYRADETITKSKLKPKKRAKKSAIVATEHNYGSYTAEYNFNNEKQSPSLKQRHAENNEIIQRNQDKLADNYSSVSFKGEAYTSQDSSVFTTDPTVSVNTVNPEGFNSNPSYANSSFDSNYQLADYTYDNSKNPDISGETDGDLLGEVITSVFQFSDYVQEQVDIATQQDSRGYTVKGESHILLPSTRDKEFFAAVEAWYKYNELKKELESMDVDQVFSDSIISDAPEVKSAERVAYEEMVKKVEEASEYAAKLSLDFSQKYRIRFQKELLLRGQYLENFNEIIDLAKNYARRKEVKQRALDKNLSKRGIVEGDYEPNMFLVSSKRVAKDVYGFFKNIFQKMSIAYEDKDKHAQYNTIAQTMLAYLFRRSKNQTILDNLTVKDRVATVVETANNAATYDISEEWQNDPYLSLIFKNTDNDSLQELNEQDLQHIELFMEDFNKFMERVLMPKTEKLDNGTVKYPDSFNFALYELIQDALKAGKSFPEILTGIKYNKDTKDLDASTITDNYMLAMLTYFDKEGNLKWNQGVVDALSLGTLRAVQDLEASTRIETKDKFDWTQLGLAKNLDVGKLQAVLPIRLANQLKASTPLSTIVSKIANNTMNILGVQSDPSQPINMNGQRLMLNAGAVAVRFAMQQGYIVRKEIFIDTDSDGNGTYAVLDEIPGKERNNPRYVTIPIYLPTTALIKNSAQRELASQQFKSPIMAKHFDSLMMHEKPDNVAFDPEELPPVGNYKLHSQAKITDSEKFAIENRSKVKYSVVTPLFALMKFEGKEGMLQLNGIDPNDTNTYNVTTQDNIDGRTLNIEQEYDNVNRLGQQAYIANEEDPALYFGGTMNASGRYQEQAAGSTQTSKLSRVIFSNAVGRIRTDGSNRNASIAFKRAILQQFGFKIKRMDDADVIAAFNKLEQDATINAKIDASIAKFTDQTSDPDEIANLVFQDLFLTVHGKMNDFIVNMETALGEPRENGSLALGAAYSFLNYMIATKIKANYFMNTMYVEGDGSCNGDFNSGLLHLANGPITKEDILKFYQSQMFLGILGIDSKGAWQIHPQDNYTANTVKTSQKLIETERFARSLNIPSINVGRYKNINAQTLADNTLGVIATILGKDFTLNWEALNEGRSDAITLARSVLKGPTTRINYEQGRTSNINNIFSDINKKLSERINNILNNPDLPYHEAFFKKEIDANQMTEEQAFIAYNQFAEGWQIISSAFLYQNKKTGEYRLLAHKNSKTKKVEVPFTAFYPIKYKWIKPTDEDRIRLQRFRLNQSTVSYQFSQNVERFYATPIYDAVNDNKTTGYKKYLLSVREYANQAATLQQKALLHYIETYKEEHHGFSPSQDEINAYKNELETIFPTTLHSDIAEIDLAGAERIDLPEYQVKARQLANLKIKGTDQPVQTRINIDIGMTMPAPGGVSSAPKMTIAGGDGTMQTLIASNEFFYTTQPNVADRYDGTEMSPSVAAEASWAINRAAFEVTKHNMAPSLLQNAETFAAHLDEYAEKVPAIKEYLDEYFEEQFGIDREDIVSYGDLYREEILPLIKQQVKSIKLNSLVMQTMPLTMEHMSLGMGSYTTRGPKDSSDSLGVRNTFEVPPEVLAAGIDVIAEFVAIEFNRRRVFFQQHPEIVEKYEKTGKLELPDAFFERSTEEAQQMLVMAQQEQFKRILDTTPSDRTIPADQLLPPRTTTVQPQATVTSSERTGRLTINLQKTFDSFITNLAKDSDFESRALKAFFTKFVNDNLLNNVKIVSSKNPADFNKPGVNANTPAYYDPNSRKIVLNEAVLLDKAKIENKTYEEILIHEMIHAVVHLRIDEGYKDKNHPAHGAVMHLQRLMEETKEIVRKADPNLYDTLKGGIWENSNTAAAINEFVAFMLTNPRLIKALENKKTSTEAKIFKPIFKLFKSIMKKVFSIKNDSDWDKFKTFYGETLVTVTTIIDITDSNPVTEASSKVSSAANKSQDSKIKAYAAAIGDVALKAALQHSQIDLIEQVKAQDRADAYNLLISKFTDEVGIPLSSNNRVIAGVLAELYNNAININSSIRLDAENLRRELVSKLKVKDFKLPNDGEFLSLAQKRYDFFTGRSNKNSISEHSDALGIFMALAGVSPEIRSILNKASNKTTRRGLTTNPEVYANESVIDRTISNFGERALQEVTNILDHPVRGNRTTTDLIDQLNSNLIEQGKMVDILSTPSSLLDKADEAIANAGDRVGTAFITGDMLTKMLKSDSKFAAAIAATLKISVPFLLKDTNQLYLANKKLMLEAVNKYAKNNPNFLSRFFTTAYKELMSSDKNADIVYETEKRAKAAIQAVRSNWRDVTPRVIKEQFAKEGVRLTQAQSASLDTAILKADLGTLTEKQVDTLMKSDLNKVIADAKGRVSPKARAKAEALAHYMTTGEATPNMLRNAEAIVRFLKTDDKIQDVDNYITLMVLKKNEADFKVLKEIYSKAPKATKSAIAQQREIKAIEEKKKNDHPDHRYNTYKGFYPQSNMTLADVKVISKDSLPMYESLGYKVIGNVASDVRMLYVQNPVAPNIAFNQGGLQAVINQVGGIDSFTGWSSNDRVSKRIKNPFSVGHIRSELKSQDETVPQKEAYIPILDETGTKIIGYELTVNPDMFTSIIKEKDFARNLGIWRGRQVEEQLATELNKSLIEQLKSMYENASELEKKNEYVDVISLAQRDPIIAKALDNIPPSTRVFLSGSNKLPTQWFIRNDLIDDVLGRKQASIVDLETGQSRLSPKAQRAVTEAVKAVLGPKGMYYLYRAEAFTKATTASARNIIVVRSGVVPAMNIMSNVVSLSIRGVSLPKIATMTPRIVKELEYYNHSRQRQIKLQIELNAERGKDRPNKRRIDALETKLREEQALVDRFTYSKDLLKAGEYNTIADIGDTNDDILLTTGKFGEYLEKQINRLPDAAKELARQGIIAKDTALYSALEKSTRYGDFVAKVLLYNHLLTKKGMSKEEALSRIRYEFVNYDMLAGRTREYLENIGLIWFYNYKLRIARTAMSMIKENPLSSLLSMTAPMVLGVGTPLTDSLIPKLATSPFGSIGPKILDLPWVTSNMWSKMFF